MCSATAAGRLTLVFDDTAPGHARTFLRHMHCRAHQTHVLDDALLLVSELVTNAVRHGAPPITMHVTCDHNTGMTVRVSDTNPTSPTAGPADHGQESGRGVGLVDVLSDEWGVEAAEAGKAVWFRLATG